jgi:hypothetical protein
MDKSLWSQEAESGVTRSKKENKREKKQKGELNWWTCFAQVELCLLVPVQCRGFQEGPGPSIVVQAGTRQIEREVGREGRQLNGSDFGVLAP